MNIGNVQLKCAADGPDLLSSSKALNPLGFGAFVVSGDMS